MMQSKMIRKISEGSSLTDVWKGRVNLVLGALTSAHARLDLFPRNRPRESYISLTKTYAEGLSRRMLARHVFPSQGGPG